MIQSDRSEAVHFDKISDEIGDGKSTSRIKHRFGALSGLYAGISGKGSVGGNVDGDSVHVSFWTTFYAVWGDYIILIKMT